MGARPVPLGPAGHTVRANLRRLRQAQHLTTGNLSAKLAAHGRPRRAASLNRWWCLVSRW